MKTLIEQRQQLLTEVNGIAAQFKDASEWTDDAASKANDIVRKIGALDERIAAQKELAKLNKPGQAPEPQDDHDYDNEPSPAQLSWREAAPREGDTEVDSKSWRETKDAFGRTIRYNVPLAVEKAGKNYVDAFEGYLRKGWRGLGTRDRKSLTEAVDNSGGFFVPTEFMAQLIARTSTGAKVRGLATVLQVGRDLVKIPRINYSTDNKYRSPVRFTWTGETPSSSTVHAVTDAVSGEIDVPIHTAMASQKVSLNLLEDSAFDIWGMMGEFFGDAFDLGEDDVFLTGNGVGKPLGILGITSDTNQTPGIVVSGTNAVFTTAGDAHEGKRLNDLYYNLPAQYRMNAVFMCNSVSMEALENLVDLQDRPIIHSLTNASMALGEPATLKGKPIVIDEFMADPANSSYSLLFGDFKSYWIFDRVGMSIRRNDELYSETNFTQMLARKRVGGYLVKPFAMRVMKLSA